MPVPGLSGQREVTGNNGLYGFKRHHVSVIAYSCTCGVPWILKDVLTEIFTQNLQDTASKLGKECLPDA
jgi:hypothetical protein